MNRLEIDPTEILMKAATNETGEPFFSFFPIGSEDLRKKEIMEWLKKIDGAIAIFNFQGELHINLDDEQITMGKITLCAFTTQNIFRFEGCSADFEGYLAIIDPYYFQTIDVHMSITYFLYSRRNRVVNLPIDDVDTTRMMMEMLHKRTYRKNHPYQKQIIREILMISLYEICALYESQLDEKVVEADRRKLRDQELLSEFLILVEQYCQSERSLKFYARKLCLTPKYLSSSIKKLSGKSGAEWIDIILMQNIKSTLISSPLTIQQVADKMNFPNASFFGKYFKKHTGMTPREFKLQY